MTLPSNDKYAQAYETLDGLPDGVYYADIEKVQFKETQNGSDMVTIDGIVTEGVHKGTKFDTAITTYANGNPIKMNMSKVVDLAQVLGAKREQLANFPQAVEVVIEHLANKKVELTVESSESKGKKYVNYNITQVLGAGTNDQPLAQALNSPAANDQIPF